MLRLTLRGKGLRLSLGPLAITRSIEEALAVQWFLEKLSDNEEWLALPSTPELLDKRLDDASEEIARLRESVALGELRKGCTDALALAERAGVALTGDAVQGFLSLLLRAYPDVRID